MSAATKRSLCFPNPVIISATKESISFGKEISWIFHLYFKLLWFRRVEGGKRPLILNHTFCVKLYEPYNAKYYVKENTFFQTYNKTILIIFVRCFLTWKRHVWLVKCLEHLVSILLLFVFWEWGKWCGIAILLWPLENGSRIFKVINE